MGDLRGCYTVKNGYRLLTADIPQDDIDCSLNWNLLWKMDIPAKIKNLLWRCLRGILPVRDVFKLRGVNLDNMCPICSKEKETIDHVFFECVQVQRIWRICGLENVTSRTDPHICRI